MLKLAGLELRIAEQQRPTLGFTAARDASGSVVVQSVAADSPAQLADLRVGDTILVWNGGEVPRRTDRWLREQKPGDLLKLWVGREEKKVSFEFWLGQIKETFYGVTENGRANEKARHIREGLLHGVTRGGVH